MSTVIQPPKIGNNLFLFVIGIILRFVNKMRHVIIGYSSPRPIAFRRDIQRSVKYTLAVVENWSKAIENYTGGKRVFYNKHVLELGPGPDLGTGFTVLALGAKSYTALDRYKLISKESAGYYKALFKKLQHYPAFNRVRTAWHQFQEQGSCDCLCYIHERNFSLNKLCVEKYDMVVSQAVLEHLDDVGNTFRLLRQKLPAAAVMVHEVDLGTHTRWIKTMDPLNLLRYSKRLYNLLKFGGSPNRLRVSDYREILTAAGFVKIQTNTLVRLADKYVRYIKPTLNKSFRFYSDKLLGILSFHLLAAAQK